MKELFEDLQILNPEQRKRLESLRVIGQNAGNTSPTEPVTEQTFSRDNMLIAQQVVFVLHWIVYDYFKTNLYYIF